MLPPELMLEIISYVDLKTLCICIDIISSLFQLNKFISIILENRYGKSIKYCIMSKTNKYNEIFNHTKNSQYFTDSLEMYPINDSRSLINSYIDMNPVNDMDSYYQIIFIIDEICEECSYFELNEHNTIVKIIYDLIITKFKEFSGGYFILRCDNYQSEIDLLGYLAEQGCPLSILSSCLEHTQEWISSEIQWNNLLGDLLACAMEHRSSHVEYIISKVTDSKWVGVDFDSDCWNCGYYPVNDTCPFTWVTRHMGNDMKLTCSDKFLEYRKLKINQTISSQEDVTKRVKYVYEKLNTLGTGIQDLADRESNTHLLTYLKSLYRS